GGKIPRPDVFPDVYSFTPVPLRGRRKDIFLEFKNKRGINAVSKNNKYVMTVRPSMLGYIKKLYSKAHIQGATLIYSM
ncbi:MAG: hypothetical protein ACI4QI_08980, partial [Candidatus Coproplasma sp.]